ncbi:MAG: acyl-ACP--UDP-N-acetylglucosamine O-acyltransferase [Rhodospirillales bacterium]
MSQIHPTAIVEPGATLGSDCQIGPYCVIGSDAVLGDGVVLHSHVVVTGRTSLGDGCKVFPFASLGHAPQDLKYRGEASALEIGRGCVIREQVTINPGTEGGGMLTKVGDGCLLMVGAHVAHDCILGDGVILANNATLAGHVQIGERSILGGLSAVQQFVRIGRNAMIGGMAGIRQDVVPFGLVMGRAGMLVGLNMVGLRRAASQREDIDGLKRLFEQAFDRKAGPLAERLETLAAPSADNELAQAFIAFLRAESAHGLMQPSGQDAA